MNNNTKKLNFEQYRKKALEFYKAKNEDEKNEVLKGLTASQVQKLANIFFNLNAKNEALFLLVKSNYLRYEENQKRKSKKFLRDVKKVYNY